MSVLFPASEGRPSDGERFQFTAREPEAETALRYHRARAFDLTIGRWTSQDPVEFAAGPGKGVRNR